MSGVSEDAGHTLVHFLYTGGYETLDEDTLDLAREYKTSVLVYHASRNWGLTGLEVLAQQKMQHLDKELPILEILRVTRDVFSSLPEGETWLPGYIQGNLQRLVKPHDPELGLRGFYDIIGQDHRFDNAVMKMIFEILSIHISYMEYQHVRTPNDIISNESPVPEEPEAVPEPEYAFEPEPEPPEPWPEDPEPAPEPEPAAVLNELPDEGDSELRTFSRVPVDADGGPCASLLPRDTPNAEILQEAPVKDNIARISCSDLNLYENWGNLSSKKRTKRVSKLRSRGLPVPSQAGFISIVAN
ncbi:hypothetical protein N7516_010442 [Penicillium verrucosum]|uniref:uncharacterized protein n=1 Tax=Penicillium verrucosum TaxID=60171 RepID=UPI0025455BD9|nr:uncharacterized protein N7516_010442 [Penicillium verrucosum]KAJ5922739.1 hypothetical protein N7516_010442 [Penicillium verrucosum]